MATKSKPQQSPTLKEKVSSVVDLFIDRSEEPDEPTTQTISCRMPFDTLHKLDALSATAKVSRSSMLIEVLELGIAATIDNLPMEVRIDVEAEYVALCQAAKEGK